MKAIGFKNSNLSSLQDYTLAKPQFNRRDLLIRVKAISVNPVDTKIRQRQTSLDGQPIIPGWDVAGIVEALGSEVTTFRVGDEVYYAGSIVRPGGNSQWHAVDERIVALKPKNLSFEDAASLPLTSLTAYEALTEQLAVKPERTILIIGGAGGVGSIAIQIAKVLGLRVVTTASRPESEKWVRKMGADFVVNHGKPLLPQLQALDLKEVDYILDAASTSQYWAQMAEIIKPFGRICSIVESPDPLDLNLFMKKSVTFSWELMFTKSIFETSDMDQQGKSLAQVARWVEEKKISPTTYTVYKPIHAEILRRVHQDIESGRSIGKIVVKDWE